MEDRSKKNSKNILYEWDFNSNKISRVQITGKDTKNY